MAAHAPVRAGWSLALLGALLLGPSIVHGQDAPPVPPADPPPAKPATPPVPRKSLAERVNEAIDEGVQWLRRRPTGDGAFGPCKAGGSYGFGGGSAESDCYPAGPTALALYTLLKCGVPPEDDIIRRGFAWLRAKQEVPETSYEVSMAILALEARANPFKTEREMRQHDEFHVGKAGRLRLGVKLAAADAAWMKKLVDELVRKKEGHPAWRYNCWDKYAGKYYESPGGNEDASSTQLALLALLAAERCGLTQPSALYLRTLDWVLAQQQASGVAVARAVAADAGAGPPPTDAARGWPYMRDSADLVEGRTTGAMTACGLASVLLCSRILESRADPSYERKYRERTEKAWWDGNAWLRRNWTVRENPGRDFYHLYYLYCLERVSDLRGARLLAGHNWYDEGAEFLVGFRTKGGYWTKDDTHGPEDLLNTCFALLFLNRSTPAITDE